MFRQAEGNGEVRQLSASPSHRQSLETAEQIASCLPQLSSVSSARNL